MLPQSIARRYARALLDVVEPRGLYDAARGQLEEVQRFFREFPKTRLFLQLPEASPQKKDQLLARIAEWLGLHPLVLHFLGIMVRNRRLDLLPLIVRTMEDLYLQRKGYVRARVITAVPLEDELRDRIVRELEQVLNRKVIVEERVRPEILGGLVIQIGSIYYDGSVTAQLRQLRNRLAGEGAYGFRA